MPRTIKEPRIIFELPKHLEDTGPKRVRLVEVPPEPYSRAGNKPHFVLEESAGTDAMGQTIWQSAHMESLDVAFLLEVFKAGARQPAEH